ncbi:TetR/AcrR family transcriptional regulator [Acerihabitans sp. KWT182]|uniref:TetR/AcrR family transcriptional regulator n=1 Tax=Acerihabitans sp. KWT182 TaxID=3157919 RepID=A0AAU7QB74_9GAMM
MNTSDKTEGLRERKKRATRQHISNEATKLFIARGFDQVTITDVADAANVSKMTVFNYFSRKEELFFDRSEDICRLLSGALDGRDQRSPLAALRALAHGLVEQEHPIARMDEVVATYWRAVAESVSLHAYALELLQQLEGKLGDMLCASAGEPADDPIARLIAAIIVNAWRIAFRQALNLPPSTTAVAPRRLFLKIIDRGFTAADAAAQGTSYA